MKISQLIIELAKVIDLNGDLEVELEIEDIYGNFHFSRAASVKIEKCSVESEGFICTIQDYQTQKDNENVD